MAETETKTYTALPNTLHVAEHKRTAFVLQVPPATTLAEIMNPGALSACLAKHNIERFCRIEVQGGIDWWAELLVTRVDPDKKRVYTKIITKAVQMSVDASLVKNDDLRVEPTVRDKWRVMRGVKNLKEFNSEAEALAWAAAV